MEYTLKRMNAPKADEFLARNLSTLSALLRGIRRVKWQKRERSRSDRAA
jgi:hypothetical protein